ncbi:MAG: 30S ribosomal protein S13 [archaeon]|nr:30S ribosomal protein S13 [archaeon]
MVEGKKRKMPEKEDVNLIRILGRDIRGDKNLLPGLTQIKGISWAFANAVCKILMLDKNKKIQDVSKEEIEKIESFVKTPLVPSFIMNRQKDFEDGEDKHLSGEDLKLRKEFDIKRLKKIRSYKGVRHAAGLPVRGQRTKNNFRKNRKKSGSTKVKKE